MADRAETCACRYRHAPDAIGGCVCGCHDDAPAGAVYIRQSASMAAFCGQSGGSISLDHSQQNPSAHVSTLPVCEACQAGVLQEKHDHAMRRKAADAPNHRCLPPRWPDTQDLQRCAWFGHRVEISVQCCRYVLACARCRKTLADLPRGDHGMATADESLPLQVRPEGPPAPPLNGRIRRGIG